MAVSPGGMALTAPLTVVEEQWVQVRPPAPLPQAMASQWQHPHGLHACRCTQCENPNCNKWRRLPAGAAAPKEDEPWFCYLNSDPQRNTCSASEAVSCAGCLLGARSPRGLDRCCVTARLGAHVGWPTPGSCAAHDSCCAGV